MIAIADYRTGNLRSVCNALARLGAEYAVTADEAVIRAASGVILPGVGSAATAMANLRAARLDTVIPTLRRPVLGICVGMQIMCRRSDEGDADCLGIFDAQVRRLGSGDVPVTEQTQHIGDGDTPAPAKVPNMGWATIENTETRLFAGLPRGSFVYFVHSYRADLCPDTIATSRHNEMFSAALRYENFYGTQFHPEKSGAAGELILSNFLSLCCK